MAPLLEAHDITVTFGNERVVEGVSLKLDRGEIVTVVGPNGSGKTTLFRALLGLVPYAGKIAWLPGISIGYVPQRFTVSASTPITATEFFLLKSERFWLPRKDFVAHFKHELDLVGLKCDILDRPLGTLSRGQLQRLLIAWAVLDHPEVLLFDEPTASVDIGFAETVYSIMRRLAEERGTAVLFISHDLNVVFRYAVKVLCINRRLICQGRSTEVLTHETLKQLFGDIALYRHDHGNHQ